MLPGTGFAGSQKATLPNASVEDVSEGNVRRIVVAFEGRKCVSEQLLDASETSPMQADFGQNGSAHDFVQKRLSEPIWLRDGAGDGYYLPIQPTFAVAPREGQAAFRLQEVNPIPNLDRKWLRLEFSQKSEAEMSEISRLMENPVLAPLQITENDDDEIIVYDLASQTTAYVITKSSERMNSAGFLSGSSQPCVVLIRVSGSEMMLAAGTKTNAGKVRLKLFGDWQPASVEKTVTSCIQKAGRTWVEFPAGTEGSPVVRLVKMPEKSYFQRIYEAFKKK